MKRLFQSAIFLGFIGAGSFVCAQDISPTVTPVISIREWPDSSEIKLVQLPPSMTIIKLKALSNVLLPSIRSREIYALVNDCHYEVNAAISDKAGLTITCVPTWHSVEPWSVNVPSDRFKKDNTAQLAAVGSFEDGFIHDVCEPASPSSGARTGITENCMDDKGATPHMGMIIPGVKECVNSTNPECIITLANLKAALLILNEIDPENPDRVLQVINELKSPGSNKLDSKSLSQTQQDAKAKAASLVGGQ